jgi:hypothetical protein
MVLLVLLISASLAVSAQEPRVTVCPVCTKQNTALGFFSTTEVRHILKYDLPSIVIPENTVSIAPWTFDLVVDSQGHVCSVQLKKGPESIVVNAMVRAIEQWKFTPWKSSKGVVYCFRSTVFVYVRKRNGRPILIVPGLSDN